MTVGDNYVFQTGRSAAARLELLERIYGPSTRMLLGEAELKPGMRVADVGCGSGEVTRQLARIVGETGHVTAIDVSDDQLRIARESCERLGLHNIRFVFADARHTGLDSGSLDAVYSRLLLSHVRQAEEVVQEFHRLLADDGAILIEDQIAADVFTDPPTEIYARVAELAVQVGAIQAVDYCIGRQLPHLLRNNGFTVELSRKVQVGVFEGEAKRWCEASVREAAAAIQKAGAIDAAVLAAMLKELERVALDETTMVYQPPLVQVRGRKRP